MRKEKHIKPKARKLKEIPNVRTEVKETEKRKAIRKINETKSWFLEKKIIKNEKPLLRHLKKEKRELTCLF